MEGGMNDGFEEVVTSRDRLREIVGQPSPAIVAKVIDHIDDICRRFIAASPFAVIASKGADGLIEVSPKGDPVAVITLKNRTLSAVAQNFIDHVRSMTARIRREKKPH
jgi:predicted pyridoxine 5'-phosphate oxidase superfamily flavin-nucleotide-binding protein